LVHAINSIERDEPQPVNGDGRLFPRSFNAESEVENEFSRS
jgi:hypothetical protein